MRLFQNLREYENLHIVLWLMKDTCWLLEWKLAGVCMAIPTIGVALHITWRHRKNNAELFHSIAVSNWICANAVWMLGEFFYDDTLRPLAGVFFGFGFISLAIYYLVILPKKYKASKG